MATQLDIESHYDVDNDFFSLFLDEKYRVYTCAVWENASNLQQAQEAKLARICKFANVQNGDRVVDVGCGWGGLMKYIVENYADTTVHGLTLSPKQTQHILSENVKNVTAETRSWEHYQPKNTKFDAIVSVCALEHFATVEDQSKSLQRDIYKSFFDWCLEVSTDDAQIGLQTIIITRPPNNITELRDSRFLLEKVFPGSALSSISDIQAAIIDKYEISSATRIGMDYARTLVEWKRNLEAARSDVLGRYGQDVYDHHIHYLDAARRCFETEYTDLYQISLKRAKPIRVFLG
ncbi:cyclopropane-fatty-acyl-phospholipid synthase family protein [Methylotenera sp. 1P/1]|jgi:cyclopropane-fatty-acyl-phospholipid synthase|uniref:SAM-dependent methyltransferase n=1 Tax=Methylotenera sp. 1P/1 TaxID=1131551 RepID=UPI000381DB20|nr:cyclopropane-fatty-acyl-phospholipid synthase family protein [Methylotenera sp. 1P/1]